MNVNRISPQVISSIRRILRENPSGTTARDLAWGLGVSSYNAHRYLNKLKKKGLVEFVGFAPEPHFKGRRPMLWRWIGE